MDADSVQKATAEHLHADDARVGRRDEFLDETRAVEPQVERADAHRRREVLGRVEAPHARAAAADVRLDQNGEPQLLGRPRHLRRVVDDARFGVGESESLEQGELQRLRRLRGEGAVAVDHSHAAPFEVGEER